MYRDAVRKANAQLELKLSRDVKNHKKGFFRYINNNQKEKENMLPNRRDELISPTMLKWLRFLTLSSPLSLPALLSLRPWEHKSMLDANTEPQSGKEGLVCELLQGLGP